MLWINLACFPWLPTSAFRAFQTIFLIFLSQGTSVTLPSPKISLGTCQWPSWKNLCKNVAFSLYTRFAWKLCKCDQADHCAQARGATMFSALNLSWQDPEERPALGRVSAESSCHLQHFGLQGGNTAVAWTARTGWPRSTQGRWIYSNELLIGKPGSLRALRSWGSTSNLTLELEMNPPPLFTLPREQSSKCFTRVLLSFYFFLILPLHF